MKNLFRGLILILIFMISCDRENDTKINLKESTVQLATHQLTAYSVIQNSKYLIVFESGLGDDHSVWNNSFLGDICNKSDVLTYDRAGYGKSGLGSKPRDINKLSIELNAVINSFSNGRKVILVGHSLGGMIVRDYAIKNPSKVAGLLFVDPSHEHYNLPTQEQEDMIYNVFKVNYGENFGGTLEARELIEDSQYTVSLSNLPNIPVIVLTSMKTDSSHNQADRQIWYDAHEMLGNGITDFKHITTINSGHYIMKDEPKLVLESLNILLSK